MKMFRVLSNSLSLRTHIGKSVRLLSTQSQLEETIFQVSRKGLVHNGKDGFIVKSPYSSQEMPETTVSEYVWRNLSKWPDHVAMECSKTGRNYTYAELRDRSAALAIRLRNKIGLKRRDTVAICLPNVPEFAIVFLGLMEAALVVTSMNPAYTPSEAAHQIKDSEPKMIFCTADNLDAVRRSCALAERIDIKIVVIKTEDNQSIPSGTINFEELSNTDGLNLSDASKFNENIDLHEMVFIPYSSGTSGLPKGVMHSHSSLLGLAHLLSGDFFYEPLAFATTKDFQDVIPCLLPLFHIYGLSIILLKNLALGCKILSMKYEVNHFLDSIVKHRATVLHLVPPIVIQLGNHPASKPSHFEHTRTIMSGAACLANTDVERLLKIAKKNSFVQGFGLTEGFVTINTQESTNYGSCGFVLPNTMAKVVKVDDASFKGIGPNESGEVLVLGPSNMNGYFKNEAATNATIIEDGWLRTGDIGHYDENGQFYVTERLKELIKVNGLQVAPAELESILRNHPDILDAVVVGIPHEKCGEVPRAFVVRKPQSNVGTEEIEKFVAKQVSKYKHISGGVHFVDTIPKTASGKILRREIKRLYC